MNKQYVIVVSLLTVGLPFAGFAVEHLITQAPLNFPLFAKWFIFSAVGIRLVLAGLRQVLLPGFTAKEIFGMQTEEAFPIVRELGFANLCFGLVGILSCWKPEWRMVSAFASGIYFGLAGLLHLVRKPANGNEQFALWTDLLIFGLLLGYYWGH